ncbi:MAG: ATP-binding cassette domain-containing protein [Candidatus Hydrogenedentes bacterium]|nr:ATP-binding cassette domain-containing protein [Candidatus Hydrogenedentota bacterium]
MLSLLGIHKHFGGVPALRGAALELERGEIHGLVGENGAGKSTLINVATGVLRPDSGDVLLDGKAVILSNPHHAAKYGIAVVHQEAELFPQLSIAENMLLRSGLIRGAGGLIRWSRTYREAANQVAALGESFDVQEPAGGLSVARRMMAEIAAAVAEQPKVLFLDEPSSSLTLKEIENLFRQIRRLRDAGVAVVYVSHRLEEVLEISDRLTVMRDGETVETRPTSEYTLDRVVAAMVGRKLSTLFEKTPAPVRRVRLSVATATATDNSFRDISLEVKRGEILGVYGFVGAGRSEFAQALFGLRALSSGMIAVDGETVNIRAPRDAVRAGIAYLPEDRLVQGVFRTHPVRSNGSVAALRSLCSFGWIRSRAERALGQRIVRDMNVRAESLEQAINTLSGGNQQKVVFGRWQATAPRVLLLDEPTRGVDVGAKAEIHRLICGMAQQSVAIVLISSELPEIMAMSDRITTLSEGRLTGIFDPKTDTKESVAAAAVPRAGGEPTAAAQRRLGALARRLQFREAGIIAFTAALCLIMGFFKPHEFFTAGNFLDVLANAALPGIVAQGAMLIICAGGIDISVGSMLGIVGAMATMAAKAGHPPLACLALAAGLGCAFSMANGGFALLARIHPIIVTLAGITIYRGLMLLLTGGYEIMQLPTAYRALADGRLFGVPKVCYYVVLVSVAVHVFLRYTITGRRVLALGDSASAARLIGLSKVRLTLLVFALSGFLVGVAAVLHAGYYGKVQANTGEGMELKAIAAAVIGGTNILGGQGSALGTLLGAFLVALLYNILILAEISSYWQNIFVGGLILLAVLADMLLQRLQGARGG